MFDIAAELLAELDADRAVGVVIVTAVHGSAPRTAGAAMAVTEDGRAIGSLSGGCVESEAYELAAAALADGGVVSTTLGTDGDFFRAALTCGGALDVIATRVAPSNTHIATALRASLAGDPACIDMAGHTWIRERAPRLVIIGAVDFARSLSDAAAGLGYAVTVVDHRPVFTTPERFPHARDVIVGRPLQVLPSLRLTPIDVVCVMTHDRGIDIEAIAAALDTPAAYIGAMGSRRAHDERVMALRELGIADHHIDRVHSPIGLDLGGSTPPETAIAILAEVIAARTGGTLAPLSRRDGPIHARTHSGAPPAPAASRHTRSLDMGNS
jgi:xanthine dehydrogenase accessory factor